MPVLETNRLICYENQLTGFYMRTTLALNGLILILEYTDHIKPLFLRYLSLLDQKTPKEMVRATG